MENIEENDLDKILNECDAFATTEREKTLLDFEAFSAKSWCARVLIEVAGRTQNIHVWDKTRLEAAKGLLKILKAMRDEEKKKRDVEAFI